MSYKDLQYIFDNDFKSIHSALKRNGVFYGWQVSAGTGTREIVVAAGEGRVNGELKRTSSPTSLTIPENTTGSPRRDIIIVNDAGQVTYVTGLASSEDPAGCGSVAPYGHRCKSPKPPDIPDTAIILAEVYVPSGISTFTNDHITDKRAFVTPAYKSILDPDDFSGSTEWEKLVNCLAAVPSEGGLVLLPNKTYEGENLVLPQVQSLALVGCGNSVLKLKSGATNSLISADLSNLTLENLTIDGNNINVHTFHFATTADREHIEILRCKFLNSQGTAIRFTGNDSFTRVLKNIRIKDNYFISDKNCITMLGTYDVNNNYKETIENVLISDNIGVSCNRLAMLNECRNMRIVNNRCYNFTSGLDSVISTRGGRNGLISKNKIVGGSGGHAIGYMDCVGAGYTIGRHVCDGNIILDFEGNGIGVAEGFDTQMYPTIVISNNKVFGTPSGNYAIKTGNFDCCYVIAINNVADSVDKFSIVNKSENDVLASLVARNNVGKDGSVCCFGEHFVFDEISKTISAGATESQKAIIVPADRRLRVYGKFGNTDATAAGQCFIQLYNKTDNTVFDETDVYNLPYTQVNLATSLFSAQKTFELRYRNADTSNRVINGGYKVAII